MPSLNRIIWTHFLIILLLYSCSQLYIRTSWHGCFNDTAPKSAVHLFELVHSDPDSWIEQLVRLIVGLLVPKIIMGCCKEAENFKTKYFFFFSFLFIWLKVHFFKPGQKFVGWNRRNGKITTFSSRRFNSRMVRLIFFLQLCFSIWPWLPISASDLQS